MSLSPLRLIAGLGLSLLIALFAYRRGALARSGVAGAVIVGTLTFGLGGAAWAFGVVAFFASSSWLTRYGAERKRAAAAEFAKAGGRRDFAQTMANGGIAALLATGSALRPDLEGILLAAFTGAMAAAAADTWATELGLLSRDPPRLVTTWREARPGENGAVSVLGLTAAATGALAIGSAVLLGKFVEGFFADVFLRDYLRLPMLALAAGFLGSVADSLLGATVQARYYCAADDAYTEKPVHSCGRPTIHASGWRWLDNDAVNFIATAVGALTGALMYLAR